MIDDDRRSGNPGRRTSDFDMAIALAILSERADEMRRRIDALEVRNRENMRSTLTSLVFPLVVGVVVGVVLGVLR